ncbi:hypothetical protein ACKWTF_008564 [Chironomus riparius]
MGSKAKLRMLEVFSSHGLIDVAILTEINSKIKYSALQIVNGSLTTLTNVKNGNNLFPDKLKNLMGYKYRIVVYNQLPRLMMKDGNVQSSMTYFMDAVAAKQNATIQYIQIENHKDFSEYWEDREMDLTLNTGVTFVNTGSFPKLLTYEETGYCALVPLPSKVSLSEMIYIKPFDIFIWCLLILSIALSACIFKVFRSRGAVDSHWLLVYGIFVMFIGQGMQFSRNNRMVLSILLQIIIFVIFVLSSLYEGEITSFMIQPIQRNRLSRFDQIPFSEYEILTDATFGYLMKDSEEFMAMKSRINTSIHRLEKGYGTEILRQHFIFLFRCDKAEWDIGRSLRAGGTVSDYYYLLPDRIFNHFVRLEASFLNPFIHKLQNIMDLAFEAGLPQNWKIFGLMGKIRHSKHSSTDNPTYLELEDLMQVFYIIIVGLAISTFVLLVEIFFHSFLRNLHFAYLGRRLRSAIVRMGTNKKKPKRSEHGALYYILHQHKKIKRLRQLKVRKIFVQSRSNE